MPLSPPTAWFTRRWAGSLLPWLLGALALATLLTVGAGRVNSAVPPPAEATAASRPTLSGTVIGADGRPIQGALVTDGAAMEVTGADGAFSIRSTDGSGDALRISATGYTVVSLAIDTLAAPVEITLQLQAIKAIYVDPDVSATDDAIDRLIDLVNATEINAVVIDVKEGAVFFDSQVPLFRDAGTVAPLLDLPSLLERLEANSIYTIARLVVFKDTLVAEARPDLAVRDTSTGGIWRDRNGFAWVNPMRRELWDANIALAKEVAALGFDEIQYDYIRFPTDGDVAAMDFGVPVGEGARVAAITGFLEQSKRALRPIGARQSADVFGYTTMVTGDLGIGQDLTALAPLVDYLSPMVYPSHFPDRSLALAGHPNDSPYETVAISLSSGRDQLGSALKLRPWLQDFSYAGMTPYGASQVRAQIDAAEAVGTSGWMLWNPRNVFSAGALGPDDGNMRHFSAPQVILPGASTASSWTRRPGDCSRHGGGR